MKRIYFSLLVLFGLSSGLFSANYYWVGGTGYWPDYTHHWAISSGGSLFHMQVPGANDTVIFDSLSFVSPNDTVYADSSILYCYTMRWENVQFHPFFANSSFASNSILKIYGSLQLDTGMTWLFDGTTRFYGLNPGNTIRTCGKHFTSIEFAGDTTGSWTLEDTLRAGKLDFTNGNFRTAGQPVYCSDFIVRYNNHADIELDTSYIELNHFCFRDSVWHFDADSSTILFLGHCFDGGNNAFGKVIFDTVPIIKSSGRFEEAVFLRSGVISADNTFRRLFLPNEGTALVIASGSVITIIDTIAVSGSCHSMNAIVASSFTPAFISKDSGAVNIDHVVLDGICTGGNASFNASNTYAGGTCTGWNFSSPVPARTLYWVGGSGDWNDSAHWSASSGGPGGECTPTPADDLVIDAASFPAGNDTISTSAENIFFHQLDWQNTAFNSFMQSATAHVYGNFMLLPQMHEFSDSLVFRDNSPNTVIQPGGHPLGPVLFVGAGTRSVQGALNCNGSFTFLHGGLHTSGNPVSCSKMNISNGMQVDFAGSAVNTGFSYYAGTLLQAAPSILTTTRFTETAGGNYPRLVFPGYGYLNGNGTQFGTVSFNGNADIVSSCSYDSLFFLAAGMDIRFASGSVQTISGLLSVNSSCAGMTILHTYSEGSQVQFVKNTGSIMLNDVILEDIDATGGASFNALNSIAISNVTGWNITPPPPGDMYWIGGTGSWNDPSHWSASSGGAPGTCLPNPLNNVFFDINSFIGAADSVKINIPYAYCKSMIWNGTTGTPSMLDIGNGNLLKCYGSFVLSSNVTASQSIIHFSSVSQGNTINSNNQRIGKVKINGLGGSWTLNGDLKADSLFTERGTFKTAGYTIDANSAVMNDSVLLDSSMIYVKSWRASDTSGLHLAASSAHFAVSGPVFKGGDGQRYNDIAFTGDVKLYNNDSIGFARFTRAVSIYGNTFFDSLFFDNPGQEVLISSGSSQTVLGKIISSATAATPIGIESSLGYVSASLIKAADTVCLDFLNLRGIAASGGAVFYSGSNSSDAGNNSGWTWNSCQVTFVNVWPGDANRDLTADNLDLLAVGIGFGKTGPARANASLNWTAQPAYAWNTLFANTSDIVNADCDGDGVIGYSDTTAILLNYGLNHPARLPAPDSVQSTGTLLWISTPITAVTNGDTASVGIMLGTATQPAGNVYGIAFQMTYNDSNIVPGSVWIEFSGSWMCPPGSEVHLVKHFPGQLVIMFGLSRTDHSNVSGYGEIARIHFRTMPGYTGSFKAWLTDIHLIDANEIPVPVTSQYGVFAIVGMNEYSASGLHAYPNPTTGIYTIDDDRLKGTKTTVAIMDMAGRIIQEEETENTGTIILHLDALSAGTYFVRLQTDERLYMQRVIRQ